MKTLNKSNSVKWAICVIITAILGLVVILIVIRFLRVIKKPKYYNHCSIKNYPFKTGDLVVTSTNTYDKKFWDGSNFIKIFTNNPFSHVAFVYVDPDTKNVFFWEMNDTGVRLASIKDFLPSKNKTIIVRSLNKTVDDNLVENIIKSQWNLYFNYDISLSYYNRFIYPYIPIPFFRGHQWENGKLRTCVHMATEMYDSLGVFNFKNSGIDPSTIFARDYVEPIIDRKMLPLANGYDFGPVILLTP